MEPYITHYRKKYFDPDKRNQEIIFSYKPKESSVELIKQKISDICISLNAQDYLDMPELIIDTKYVQLDSKAKSDYKQFEKDMFLQLEDDAIDVASAAALTNKLLQFSNGAVYKQESDEFVEVHKCKIEALMELIEGLQGQHALIFYNFKHDLERIQKAIKKMKLRVGILKSAEDITKWNNGELDILLAHPASAAYGLNLQEGGNHVIWFGLNWSLELYKQANARLYRQGQKEKVVIHHLVAVECVDENVLAALEEKDSNQNKLLEILKARIKQVKQEA